jgi:hypothetical protein
MEKRETEKAHWECVTRADHVADARDRENERKGKERQQAWVCFKGLPCPVLHRSKQWRSSLETIRFIKSTSQEKPKVCVEERRGREKRKRGGKE